MDGKEEGDDLELRLNKHITETNRRFTDHENMFVQTNGTLAAQRKLIDATQKQVDAQLEGTEVLREVAVLLKDFTDAMRPLVKGLAWIGRTVKYVGYVAGGVYAIWYVVKPAIISALHWLRIV